MPTSDVPAPLEFVNPSEVDSRWRVCLYSVPGVGKTVAACSAPDPIIALSADRPGAYRYARRHHGSKTIHESRFKDWGSVRELYEHVRGNQSDVGTVILDPWNAMYDRLVKDNTSQGGKPNWNKVNDIALAAVQGFRDLDVNLVIVAHERREQDENADTEAKIYPQLGGPALVQKIMGELDIVARVFRRDPPDGEGESTWEGQLVDGRGYQAKDSTGSLGRTRVLDLAEWFDTANEALSGDDSDVPFDAAQPPQPELEKAA